MAASLNHDVTRALEALKDGQPEARHELLDLVYRELHQLAAGQMRRERANHTLQPTALVHEAYVRLLGNEPTDWENRAHFFGAAAEVMRRILVDHARARSAAKRGGGVPREPLSDLAQGLRVDPDELLAIDEALTRLADQDPQRALVVQLRFFAGLTAEEIAEATESSVRTVKRQWRFARAWLYREIGRD